MEFWTKSKCSGKFLIRYGSKHPNQYSHPTMTWMTWCHDMVIFHRCVTHIYVAIVREFVSLSLSVFLSSRVLCVSAPPPEERASHASGKPLHNGSPWFRGYLCRMRSFRSRSCVTRSNTISCHAGFHEIPARKTGLIGWRAITTSQAVPPLR